MEENDWSFDLDLFSGTRSRSRPINTEGYVAKHDEPLWFNAAHEHRSQKDERLTLKLRLDYLYYQQNYAAVVELSTELIKTDSSKENSFKKELIETKCRALMHLNKYAEAAQLLDDQHVEFATSGDLELIWCSLRGKCAFELGDDRQAAKLFWRIACMSPDHIPCWSTLTLIYLQRGKKQTTTTTFLALTNELALLCALCLRDLLARVTAHPGRNTSREKLEWPKTYSSATKTFLETSLAELALRNVKEREGLAQQWCERAREASWDEEELQLICKCMASADAAPQEDINPAVL